MILKSYGAIMRMARFQKLLFALLLAQASTDELRCFQINHLDSMAYSIIAVND